MKKAICSMIILLFVSVTLCSCTFVVGRAKPEDTIYKFETAFNNYDIEQLLECYEPSVQSMYEGMMELGGGLIGVDIKTIVSGLGAFANLYGDSFEGDLPKIDVTINSLEEVSEDKVLADLTISYTYSEEMGEQLPSNVQTVEQMYAYLIYLDDTWFISAEEPII